MYLIKKVQFEEPTPVRESLEALARSMKMPSNTSSYKVFDIWPELVGEYIASQSKPLSFQDRTLIVSAANGVIAKELILSSSSLVNMINSFLKTQVIDKIEVKTGAKYARGFRQSG